MVTVCQCPAPRICPAGWTASARDHVELFGVPDGPHVHLCASCRRAIVATLRERIIDDEDRQG